MLRHISIRPVAALLLAAAVGAMVASPVLAGGQRGGVQPAVVHQPDGLVRYYRAHTYFGNYVDPTPWVGNNIYNSTGTNQTAKKSTSGTYESGDFFEFQVSIQNDGSAERFAVHATGQGSTFKYLHGTTNITSAVVAGTFRTPSLAPGTTYMITVRVNVATGERLIKVSSVADPSKADTVRVKVKYSGCGC